MTVDTEGSEVDLAYELEKTQTILGFVLLATGRVEITDEMLTNGFPPGARIAVEQKPERDGVTVELVVENGQ